MRTQIATVLKRKPDDLDALRILAALDHADASPSSASLASTGLFAWEKHDAAASSYRAFHNGQTVGRVFKRSKARVVSRVWRLIIVLPFDLLPSTVQSVEQIVGCRSRSSYFADHAQP
ncbi:MAG: hypothetical protein Q7J57_08455 [Gemmobacter sp.]|nr:hypothetical protein [Gemmobacter sp.]